MAILAPVWNETKISGEGLRCESVDSKPDKDIKVLENANQKLVSTTSILQNSFEDLERDLEKKESLDRNQEEKLLKRSIQE